MADQTEDFWLLYSTFCVRSKVYPLKSVLRHLKGTELCCPVEAIRPEHWLFVLSALCSDNSLTKVHFASCISPHGDDCVKPKRSKREKGFPMPYGRTEQNIRNICVALAGLLQSSQHLVELKLENLSFKISDAEQLASGLKDSQLKILSFSNCLFENGTIPIICRSLQSSSISWLDLSSCALNAADVEAICLLIKAHSVKRSNQMFPETLRYNFADFSNLAGISRVSLNYNLLENESVLQLVEYMADDFWMKAIDLQNCGIDNEGGEAFLKLASSKCELEVIDLSLNDVDEDIVRRIEQQLSINRAGKIVMHSPMPLWKLSDMVRKYNTVRKVKIPKKPALYKFRVIKKSNRSLDHSSVKLPSAVHNKTSSVKDAASQTSYEIFSEFPEHVQVVFGEIKNKYQYELKLRKFFMSKYSMLKSENEQLQELLRNQGDDIYIDQETYFDIKHTFEKLKIFFDVMKKYGTYSDHLKARRRTLKSILLWGYKDTYLYNLLSSLWEYISMLGFDESTDVILTENDSLKQMTVTRKEQSVCDHQHKCRLEENGESCCRCQKIDPKHHHIETCGQCEVSHNCVHDSNGKEMQDNYTTENAKENFLKEKGPYRLLQELVNDYSGVSNQKLVPGKQTNPAQCPEDHAKATSSKQTHSLSPKGTTGAHMLIKKFSYANMPKKLKELITPADFYKIVKKELERCENEAKKPFPPVHVESSSQTHVESSSQTSSSFPPQGHAENYTPVRHFESNSTGSSNKQSAPVSYKEALSTMISNDEDDDNVPISELIARELAAKRNHASPKYAPSKKEPAKSSVSSRSKSKADKDIKLATTEGQHNAQEDTLTYSAKSMPSVSKASSSSSQTCNKKVQTKSNASVHRSNSIHSIVSDSDKLSSSSATSSVKSKTQTKSSSSLSNSEPQKSYIESVSDASTFKDVKSISMSEIASEVFEVDETDSKSMSSVKSSKERSNSSRSSNKKGISSLQAVEAKVIEPKSKNISSAKIAKNDSVGSQSSTIKDAPELKNGKVDQTAMPKSPVQSTSKKPEKTSKADSPPKEKTKNGKNSKNRPKSNSKSSSVPSLNDITSLSSQSLDTDSIMKQISNSEGKSK